MTTHLIIGLGEVGTAINKAVSEKYQTATLDINTPKPTGTFDFIHICYPYSNTFVAITNEYRNEYAHAETVTIIHSTVAIGTTEKIYNAVHSPIRGVHPHLYEGVKAFVKLIGANDNKLAAEVEYLYATLNIASHILTSSRNSEALKLWCTTQYGWMIILQKEIYAFCKKYGLEFEEVYSLSNITYNEGYSDLNMEHVVRPVLRNYPGKIGGHCVIPNAELMDCDVTRLLLAMNEKY
jgi:UDP-N-acetyl-D-mannosaminuronate dehydrogenase